MTPKQRFLRDNPGVVKVHADVAASAVFQIAADAAMLELIDKLSGISDPVGAAAAYHQIIGARNYLRLFQTIADMPQPPAARLDPDNLDRTV